jgi:tRNA-modifying protein YgfZ
MAPAKMATLPDRGIVRVGGEDAENLLQGIVTNDMGLLTKQPAIHAALLTPQGKILFDFFVVKAPGGFLLETAAQKVAELIKRLQMYRLRAKVEIADASATYRILAIWGAASQRPAAIAFPDPRLAELGWRIGMEAPSAPVIAAIDAGSADYHAHRIALGVPEGGKDFAFGDAFPHEADLDLLNGVSFDKGCFVGQEVVSRMQHRGHARKRVVPIEGEEALSSGADVTAGAAVIGKVGSVAGRQALAMVRLDRWAEAKAKGEPIAAGGVPVSSRRTSWTGVDLTAGAAAEAT